LRLQAAHKAKAENVKGQFAVPAYFELKTRFQIILSIRGIRRANYTTIDIKSKNALTIDEGAVVDLN